MKADYHVHTYYSDDSECPMEEMIKKAVSIHLDEIAFTDHVDYGVKTAENCDYDSYFKEINRCRKKYAGVISIKAGIEFGIQSHTIPLFEKAFKKYNFDFVILSNHQIGDKAFWNYEFQEGKTQKEFHERYYEALYEVVREYKNYSVLGHLDMIKRYDEYGDYPDNKILHIVEKILTQAIEDGKGIEVNTSCFKYGLKDLTPSRAILKLYYELGGEVITIGSDSHDTAYLGSHIEEVKQILKELGYRRFCTFEKMKPVYHNL